MSKDKLYKKVNIEIAFWQGVFGLAIIVGGVVSSAFNFIVAYKLTPLSQNIDVVEALTKTNADDLLDHEARIRENEKRINAYEGSIKNIETDLERLTNYFFEGSK